LQRVTRAQLENATILGITVSYPGFKTNIREKVTINSADRVRLEIALGGRDPGCDDAQRRAAPRRRDLGERREIPSGRSDSGHVDSDLADGGYQSAARINRVSADSLAEIFPFL